MTAILRDRPGVPIAQVGTWPCATGEWTCTREDLQSAVAAQYDPAFRGPIVKIGHTDPRFTDGQVLGDGQPAIGRLQNLRLSGDGTQLLADIIGIPAWLDDILESAYPSRSVECMTQVRTAGGARYRMVVTGLALLGEQPPAIETLGDIAKLFGVPTNVDAYVAAASVAAAALPPVKGPDMPKDGRPVLAAASMDALCCAAEEWAENQPLLGPEAYVRDIYTDSVILNVWLPGGESRMYRIPWTEADGAFTFGDPVQVRPSYEEVPQGTPAPATGGDSMMMSAGDAAGAIARRIHIRLSAAVPSGRGRDVTAGEHPKEYIVPISPAIAEALGLPEDADDSTVLEALEKLRNPGTPSASAASQEGGTPAPAPTPTTPQPELDELIDQRVAAALSRTQAPLLSQIEALSTEVAASRTRDALAARDRVIGDAIAAGKITRAARGQWETDYDANPDLITSVLARLAPNTAVHVTAAGRADVVLDDQSAEDEAFYRRLYKTGTVAVGGE